MKWWIFLIAFMLFLVLGLFIFKLINEPPAESVNVVSTIDNISVCDAKADLSEKNGCYFSFAKQERDSASCKFISDVSLRGDCYLIVEGK